MNQTSTPPGAPVPPTPVSTGRPLAGLLTTQFFGAFNDNALKLMVALLAGGVAADLVADVEGKEMARQEQLALATVVFTLPLMLFSLPSALLADRFSKRSIILAMKLLEFGLMAAGAAVLFLEPRGGVWLMVVLAAMGLQSAIFSPAKYGIMPELLDETHISRGNGLLELWTFLAIIAGGGAAGALLDLTDPQPWYAMLLLASFSVVGLFAAWFVPRVPPAASGADVGSLGAPIAGAWRAIRADRTLQLVICGQTVFWGLASLLGNDVLTYAKQELGMADTMAGITYAVFGVGVGIGSVVAGRISHHRIEPGLIPMGALGLAFGTTLMGILTPGYAGTLTLMGVIGVAAGFVVVPLEAMLQWYAPADRRGAVIAIANVPVFFGVLMGSLIVYFLAIVGGYSSADILTIAGLLTVAGTLWAMWLLPQALLRMFVLFVTNTFYRLRVLGREHLPEQGAALIVVNHVSFVDGLFLITSSDRPIRFLVDSSYFHHWLLRPFMRMLGAIPISAESPRELMRAMKEAGKYLRAGELVCIFAEGEITRTGAMLPFRRGLTRILKGNEHVPIVPAHLDRVWGSLMSSRHGGFLRGWNGPLPRRITLSFGAALPATVGVSEIRRRVKRLDEQAWRLRGEDRPPLHHTLVRTCRKRPFRMAVCDTTGRRLSRLKMLAGSVAMSRHLATAWGDQEHVGILLPPSAGCIVANFAVAISGRVSVNLNYTVGTDGLASAVAQAGLASVVTSRAFLQRAAIVLPEGPRPLYLEDLRDTLSKGARLQAVLAAMLLPIRSLARFARALRPVTSEDLVTIIFSSGSTGEPKGVMLSHANIDSNAEAVAEVLNPHPSDRVLGILPQFHSFGYMAMWFSANNGMALVCHSNPMDAAQIGPLVADERVTILIATPTFLQVYLRRCAPGHFGSLRAVITGAEKLPQAAADAFEDRFGIRPLEGYGTSECSPVVAVGIQPFRAPGFFQAGSKRGSIGQALPGVAVEIVDPETFAPLPLGEPGMLLVRGPNVMQGYLGRDDLTAAAMHDGWYVTGDIARMDDEGYIFITDRLARFSKIGGEMVPHGKIETALHEAADTTDQRLFSVTGIPDPKKGERLAVIHTIDESRLPGILERLAQSGLPNLFMPRPDQFVRVDEIPILGTGKVDLKRVKQIALEHF